MEDLKTPRHFNMLISISNLAFFHLTSHKTEQGIHVRALPTVCASIDRMNYFIMWIILKKGSSAGKI